VIARCGYGFRGCVPPTPDERLQRYARALGGHYEPTSHARRAAAGLALLVKLRALWRRLDRLKRKAKPRKAKPKPSNVVLLRKRRA
jgi:hypothetical protein